MRRERINGAMEMSSSYYCARCLGATKLDDRACKTCDIAFEGAGRFNRLPGTTPAGRIAPFWIPNDVLESPWERVGGESISVQSLSFVNV